MAASKIRNSKKKSHTHKNMFFFHFSFETGYKKKKKMKHWKLHPNHFIDLKYHMQFAFSHFGEFLLIFYIKVTCQIRQNLHFFAKFSNFWSYLAWIFSWNFENYFIIFFKDSEAVCDCLNYSCVSHTCKIIFRFRF